MQGEIGLACIFKSDTSPQDIFPVSIHVDKLVGDLQKAIKAENPSMLTDIDAFFQLNTPISVSADDEFNRQFKQAVSNLKDHVVLCSALSRISRYFTSTPPEESLHIIVVVPPAGECA
jgi:hypothetical protein